MKILKMKVIKDLINGLALDPENQCIEHMAKLETKEEQGLYNTFGDGHKVVNMMLADTIKQYDYDLGPDDIVYIFSIDEEIPSLGETFTLDDMEWERIS